LAVNPEQTNFPSSVVWHHHKIKENWPKIGRDDKQSETIQRPKRNNKIGQQMTLP
jgi:hypothetical protein